MVFYSRGARASGCFLPPPRNGQMERQWHLATANTPVPRECEAGPPFPWWAMSNKRAPKRPVLAGTDLGGGPLFVGRAWHQGHLLPAKAAPDHHGAFVAWGGREHIKLVFQFEVLHLLRGRAEWIEASDGEIPAHAFPIGILSSGRTTFCVRATIEGIIAIGRIVEGDKRCYVSYDGKEYALKKYEVLAIF